jgi:hypothetical protein
MTDAETADRVSRKRARVIPVLAIVFVAGQAAYFSQDGTARIVDHVRIGAWLIWSVTLLTFLATGGGFIYSRKVRALMNDEVTRANRMRGYATGFWAASGSAIGLYGLNLVEPVSGRDAIHIILTAAIAGALLAFGMLERRTHRDG